MKQFLVDFRLSQEILANSKLQEILQQDLIDEFDFSQIIHYLASLTAIY